MSKGQSPADALNETLPKVNDQPNHHAALAHGEVGAALAKARAAEWWTATKLAFEFLLLTATRSNEVIGAQWDEVDLEAAVWTIPASRMKAGREHRVPLSSQAVALLREARRLHNGNVVFPGQRAARLHAKQFARLKGKAGIEATTHGFRSSFRDWAAETGADHQASERALAHNPQTKVEAAYFRTDLLDQRRELMQAWADYLTG